MEDLDDLAELVAVSCSCKLCGGELGVLGKLGKLTWLQCRNCGMQFSIEAEPESKKPE